MHNIRIKFKKIFFKNKFYHLKYIILIHLTVLFLFQFNWWCNQTILWCFTWVKTNDLCSNQDSRIWNLSKAGYVLPHPTWGGRPGNFKETTVPFCKEIYSFHWRGKRLLRLLLVGAVKLLPVIEGISVRLKFSSVFNIAYIRTALGASNNYRKTLLYFFIFFVCLPQLDRMTWYTM